MPAGCWLPDQSLSARRAWIEIIEEVSKYVVKESLSARRAWIEISLHFLWCRFCRSLSARRAWIEIVRFTASLILPLVALRKESVDRNFLRRITITVDDGSLSARRAWIEIIFMLRLVLILPSRSPQGERG